MKKLSKCNKRLNIKINLSFFNISSKFQTAMYACKTARFVKIQHAVLAFIKLVAQNFANRQIKKCALVESRKCTERQDRQTVYCGTYI